VEYFDGTYTLLRGGLRVDVLGRIRAPVPQDWDEIEREATRKYMALRSTQKGLAFGPSYWRSHETHENAPHDY